MALAEIKELVEKVQGLTKKIQVQTDEAEEILGKYKKKFNDVEDIENGLAKIKEDLQNVQERATDKVVIEFIGAVNSGKSSLINALLRDDRLPTSWGESTVCSFKIVATEEERWSLQLDGETEKKYGDDFNEIKQLCSKMCDRDSRAKRDELKITAKSELQMNWPITLCKLLPPNIVLHDTPGFGESSGVLDVLKKSCKKADILVAVMDTKTPSLLTISELVNEAKAGEGGKYTFGVYTKWDEFMENKSRGNVPVDVEYLQKDHKQNYLERVCGKETTATETKEEDVFFVDVGHGERFDDEAGTKGTEGFLKFEKRLVESAKESKCKIIEEWANSVKSESERVFEEFQAIIDAKGKKTEEELSEIASLKEELESFTEIIRNVKSPTEIMDALFTEDNILELVKTFEDSVKTCAKEEEVLQKFIDIVESTIEKAEVTETTRINQEYDQWKKNRKSRASLSFCLPESLPRYEFVEFTPQQKLPTQLYNKFLDLHTYKTSKAFWGILAITSGAVAMALTPGSVLTGAATAVVVGARAFSGFVVAGGVTAAIRYFSGNEIMSQKKMKCWKENLSIELRKLRAEDSNRSAPIQIEMDLIFNKICSETEKVPNDKFTKLTADVEDLKNWSAKLKQITICLEKKERTFEELQPTSKTPKAVSEDLTENQSVNDSTGTPINAASSLSSSSAAAAAANPQWHHGTP